MSYYIFKTREWNGYPNIEVLNLLVKDGYLLSDVFKGTHYPSNNRKIKFNNLMNAFLQLFSWIGMTPSKLSNDAIIEIYNEANNILNYKYIYYIHMNTNESYFIYYYNDPEQYNTRKAISDLVKYDIEDYFVVPY